MGLTGWIGKEADDALLRNVFRRPPVLVLDAANRADPFRFLPLVDAEDFDDIYVIGFDLIYSLPDALREVPRHAERLGIERVAVTSFERLFNYQDAEENADIRLLAWELLSKLAGRYEVHVAVRTRRGLAERYCTTIRQGGEDMGHTVSSQRQVLDRMVRELHAFGEALRAEDLPYYRALLKEPLRHVAPLTNAASLHAWAFLVLCVCMEQEKRLQRLERMLQKDA